MNAFVALPNAFNWTPQQLAEAVPLRLSEAALFDAACLHGGLAAANAPRERLRIAHQYRAAAALPTRFRIS